MAAPQNMSPTWRHGPLSTERQACSAPVEMDRSWYRTIGIQHAGHLPQVTVSKPVQRQTSQGIATEQDSCRTNARLGNRFSSQSKTSWESTTINGLDCFNKKKPRNPDASYKFLGFSSRCFVRKAGPNMFSQGLGLTFSRSAQQLCQRSLGLAPGG